MPLNEFGIQCGNVVPFSRFGIQNLETLRVSADFVFKI